MGSATESHVRVLVSTSTFSQVLPFNTGGQPVRATRVYDTLRAGFGQGLLWLDDTVVLTDDLMDPHKNYRYVVSQASAMPSDNANSQIIGLLQQTVKELTSKDEQIINKSEQMIKELTSRVDALAFTMNTEMKRLQWSVTHVEDLGKRVMEQSTIVAWHDFKLPSVEAMKPQQDIKAKWEAATAEPGLQEVLLDLLHAMTRTPQGTHLVDTHARGFANPTAKPDCSLLLSLQKLWPDLFGIIEVKFYLTRLLNHVAGQLQERWNTLQEQQPLRVNAMFLALGQTSVMLFRFSRNEMVRRSSEMRLDLDDVNSPGLQALAAYIAATPATLGFVSTPPPPMRVKVKGVAVTSLHAITLAGSRRVFKAVSEQSTTVVLKLSTDENVKREAKALSTLAGTPGLPTLVAHGGVDWEVDGYSHGLLISPYGEPLTCADSIDDILQAMLDIAKAIKALHERGWVHRDVTPDNMIRADGKGILLDLHVAEETLSANLAGAISTGKALYMALWQVLLRPRFGEALSGQQAALLEQLKPLHKLLQQAADFESLFYSLLSIASDGAALRWRKAVNTAFHRDVRIVSMENCGFSEKPQWRKEVLSRCRQDLRDCVQALHDLFFLPQAINADYKYRLEPSALLPEADAVAAGAAATSDLLNVADQVIDVLQQHCQQRNV